MGSIVYHKGSLFEAPSGAILAHACNCQGVWGSGIAKDFAARFPDAYDSYRAFCVNEKPRPGALKLCFTDHHIIGCLLTSYNYGSNMDSVPTILEATERAINRLRIFTNASIYSNKFNSGFFRVPWEKTEEIIKRIWPRTWHVYEGAE